MGHDLYPAPSVIISFTVLGSEIKDTQVISLLAFVSLFYGTGARACNVFSTGARAIYIRKNEDIWETLGKTNIH